MEKLKELDRKILTGAIITVAFLILWLVTIPAADKQNPDKIYDSMNATQKEMQNINDTDNYNKATLLKDNSFCQNILNSTLKKDCLKKVPEKTEPSSEETQPQSENESPADIENYNTALFTKNKEYCAQIISEQMKADCESRLS